MKSVEQFEVFFYQYLDENGQLLDAKPPALAQNKEALIKLYSQMVLVRAMDAKAVTLQRTGKLGTYPSTRGQEAVFVGVGKAMEREDIFLPYYRDIGTLMQRGVPLSQILLYWGGDERGNDFTHSEDFPFSVPVGSQPLHATGVAYAVKYKKENRAVLVMCGDGATSQGDFYEALNVAGIWKLPVVFVICNNQWAISVPREAQTAAKTLAQKAIAAGFVGEQVDGNDIIAVTHRTTLALEKARSQHTPTLLEIVCYRHHDHTTADDASRYESKVTREQEWKREPIVRLRTYLEHIHAWSAAEEEALLRQCALEIDQAVADYLAVPPQPLTSMVDYLYAQLPSIYQEQRNRLAAMEQKSHA